MAEDHTRPASFGTVDDKSRRKDYALPIAAVAALIALGAIGTCIPAAGSGDSILTPCERQVLEAIQ